MKLRAFSLCIFACTACAFDIDDFLDRLDTALTISAFQDNLRARLSGTLDLEIYHFEQPAPGLIDSNIDTLFNPRLTLFLDTQIGSQIYFFAQSRLDRGFDPSNHGAQIRLDEYALRITPWEDGRFTLQAGKFATVVGNWVPRHLSWDNPFINAPLVYENVTPIQDKSAPYSPLYFIYGPYYYEKYAFNPVIWGPSYASGFSISGKLGQFDYAVEIKNASLSSRPESWEVTENGFQNPTFSSRVGFRPTRRGILASQQVRAHIFGAKPNPHCRPDATSMIIANLFLGRMPVSPGIICKCGPKFMKRGSRFRTLATQTQSLTTSKQNTNLRRSSLALFAGTNSSSAQSATATVMMFNGVEISAESTSPQRIASRHTHR